MGPFAIPRAPRAVAHGLDEQQLDRAAVEVLRQHAGGDDARVVDHEAIASTQELGQLTDVAVGGRTVGAVHDQQAGGVAALRGCLRDAVGWQVIIELGDVHDR